MSKIPQAIGTPLRHAMRKASRSVGLRRVMAARLRLSIIFSTLQAAHRGETRAAAEPTRAVAGGAGRSNTAKFGPTGDRSFGRTV